MATCLACSIAEKTNTISNDIEDNAADQQAAIQAYCDEYENKGNS